MCRACPLLIAVLMAISAPAQDPSALEVEYRRALDEHRQALEQSRQAEVKSARFNQWLAYISLAALAGLVLLAYRRSATARRRLDEHSAQEDLRHQEFLARADRDQAQTARVIELLESIDAQLRNRGSPSAAD